MNAAPTTARRRTPGRDVVLVGRQLGYEQLAFWRNPIGALFTVGFSLVFLVLTASAGGRSRVGFLGGIRAIQYYVPGFIAYGVMSACFNILAITLVARREMGLLKRLRLSPLPTWALIGGIVGSTLIVCVFQVVLVLAVGKLAYGVALPHNYAALAFTLLVGVITFTALGVAVSSFIPNQEAAGPVLGIVFFVLLFLSGLWYPLTPGSGMARFSSIFPFRHLILATFAPFYDRPGVSAWAWPDLRVMAIWAVGGILLATRRMQWAPRRGSLRD